MIIVAEKIYKIHRTMVICHEICALEKTEQKSQTAGRFKASQGMEHEPNDEEAAKP
jgi:hypothetical protein